MEPINPSPKLNPKPKLQPQLTHTTANPLCPTCNRMGIHTKDEWLDYHPNAGHGYSREHGTPPPADK